MSNRLDEDPFITDKLHLKKKKGEETDACHIS